MSGSGIPRQKRSCFSCARMSTWPRSYSFVSSSPVRVECHNLTSLVAGMRRTSSRFCGDSHPGGICRVCHPRFPWLPWKLFEGETDTGRRVAFKCVAILFSRSAFLTYILYIRCGCLPRRHINVQGRSCDIRWACVSSHSIRCHLARGSRCGVRWCGQSFIRGQNIQARYCPSVREIPEI